MSDHLEAAIQAGATVLRGLTGSPSATGDTKAIITAALPHLRRAIIQELTDEAYGELSAAFGDAMPFSSAPGWLSAKLKEAENND